MKNRNRFNKFVEWLKQHAEVKVPRDDWEFANGNICGHYFRVFTERSYPYILICDNDSRDSSWPAFYTRRQIMKWINKKNKQGASN